MDKFVDVIGDILRVILGRRKSLSATLKVFTAVGRELNEHVEAFKSKMDEDRAAIVEAELRIEESAAEMQRAQNALRQINAITGESNLSLAA